MNYASIFSNVKVALNFHSYTVVTDVPNKSSLRNFHNSDEKVKMGSAVC